MKKSLSLLIIGSFIASTMTKVSGNHLQSNSGKIASHTEPVFYYHKNQKPVVIFNDWYQKNQNWMWIHTFNLGKINPTKYKIINFLGQKKDFYSKVSWGNSKYYGKSLRSFSYIFGIPQSKITHRKIVATDNVPMYISESRFFVLQNFVTNWCLAYLEIIQFFVLTWYYENGSYYLQVFSYYCIKATNSYIGGGVWLAIGTGIEFLLFDL